MTKRTTYYWGNPLVDNLMLLEVQGRRDSYEALKPSVSPAMARQAAAIAQSYPQFPGSLVAGMAVAGIDPGSEAALELGDKIAGEAAAAAAQARPSESPEVGYNITEPDEPGFFGKIGEGIKTGVKGLFLAFDFLWEEGIQRPLRAAVGNYQHDRPWYEVAFAPFFTNSPGYKASGPSIGNIALHAALQGHKVNLGSGWFLDADLAPETERALADGTPFMQAIANPNQMELGVPISHLQRNMREQTQIAAGPGRTDTIHLTPGRLIATQFMEQDETEVNWASGIIDFAANVVLDPANIFMGAAAKARRASRALVPTGVPTKLMGRTWDEWLATPHGVQTTKDLAEIRSTEMMFNILKKSERGVTPGMGELSARLADTTDPNGIRQILSNMGKDAVGLQHVPSPQSLIGRAMGRQATPFVNTMSRAMGRGQLPRAASRLGGPAFSMRYSLEGTWMGKQMAQVGAKAIDVNDIERGMVDLQEWMRGAGFTGDQISKYLRRMIDAERSMRIADSGAALTVDRYDSVFNVITDMVDEWGVALEAGGIPKAGIKAFGQIFNDALEMRNYFRNAANQPQFFPGAKMKMMFDGKLYTSESAHLWSEFLNRAIPLPDSRQVRIAMRRAAIGQRSERAAAYLNKNVSDWEHVGENTIQMLGDAYMQKIWKPMVLMRAAWPVRVVGEEQLRMAVEGLSNVFSHPIQSIAWAMSKTVGDFDVLGAKMDDALDFQRTMTGHGMANILDHHGARQPGKDTWVSTKKGDPRWAEGAHNNLVLLHKDEIARTLAGGPTDYHAPLDDLTSAFHSYLDDQLPAFQRADAFDAIPDEADVWVFHSTNRSNADHLGEAGWEPGYHSFTTGSAEETGQALYVSTDWRTLKADYGEGELVAFRVPKSHVRTSIEAEGQGIPWARVANREVTPGASVVDPIRGGVIHAPVDSPRAFRIHPEDYDGKPTTLELIGRAVRRSQPDLADVPTGRIGLVELKADYWEGRLAGQRAIMAGEGGNKSLLESRTYADGYVDSVNARLHYSTGGDFIAWDPIEHIYYDSAGQKLTRQQVYELIGEDLIASESDVLVEAGKLGSKQLNRGPYATELVTRDENLRLAEVFTDEAGVLDYDAMERVYGSREAMAYQEPIPTPWEDDVYLVGEPNVARYNHEGTTSLHPDELPDWAAPVSEWDFPPKVIGRARDPELGRGYQFSSRVDPRAAYVVRNGHITARVEFHLGGRDISIGVTKETAERGIVAVDLLAGPGPGDPEGLNDMFRLFNYLMERDLVSPESFREMMMGDASVLNVAQDSARFLLGMADDEIPQNWEDMLKVIHRGGGAVGAWAPVQSPRPEMSFLGASFMGRMLKTMTRGGGRHHLPIHVDNIPHNRMQFIPIKLGHSELGEMVATGKLRGMDITNPKNYQEIYRILDDELAEFLPQFGKVTKQADPTLGSQWDKAVSNIFGWLMSKPTNYLSRSPAFRQFYWRKIGELIPLSSAEDQATMLMRAREAGIGRDSIRTWIRRIARGDTEVADEDVVRALEKMISGTGRTLKGTRAAGGALAGTIEDIDHLDEVAKAFALEQTRRLLYDLSKKSNFFDMTRLIFPFGEAWYEIISTWGRLIRENPQALRRLQQGVEGARETGFFYEDPTTGDEVFNYPGADILAKWMFEEQGEAGELSGEATSEMGRGDVAAPQLTGRVLGLNLMLGSWIPGMGPIIQIPASQLEFLKEPDWRFVRELVLPFGATDVESVGDIADTQLPAWFRKALTALGAPTGDDKRLYGNTVIDVYRTMLLNGADDSTPEAASALLDEAKRKARGIYRIRALSQFAGPTGAQVRWDAVDKEGRTWALQNLATEYRVILEEHDFDQPTAFRKFVEIFGLDPSGLYTAKTRSVRRRSVTEAGAEWESRNGGLFEQYPLTAYYARPDDPDEEFDYPAYLKQLDEKNRVPLSPEDWALERNDFLGRIAYEKARRNAAIYGGSVAVDAWLRNIRYQLQTRYPGFNEPLVGGVVQAERTQVIEELEGWRDSDELMDTETGQGLAIYMNARDFAKQQSEWMGLSPLGFQSAARTRMLRDWLRTIAQDAVRQYPDFGVLWDQVLSSELSDEQPFNLMGVNF